MSKVNIHCFFCHDDSVIPLKCFTYAYMVSHCSCVIMIVSYHWNALHITGTLCGESNTHWWLALTNDHQYGALMFSLLSAWRSFWTDSWVNLDMRRHGIHACQCNYHFIVQYVIKSWWRHQMETYFALLAICAGNSPVTDEFPAQRPVTRSFDVFFDLRLNKRLS